MAVYRKKLLDKDGNTIIPAVGDIYGTVYNATLSSATAGGRADYDFTPDTPVENNKVYAVMFPAPTVNNATIILGDGVSSGSILVPTVAATDSPNYELLTTDMINDTEPLLLMYNGVQWVCLNQKKKVATADLENNAITSDKVNWATFKIPSPGEIVQTYGNVANADKSFTMPSRGFFSCKTSVGIGDYVYIYINGIVIAGQYKFGGAKGSISQVYVIFPVGVGDTVRVVASGSNSLAEGIQLLSARWV